MEESKTEGKSVSEEYGPDAERQDVGRDTNTVYHELRTAHQHARMDKEVTQAQLTKTIRKSAIINEYEHGKAIWRDTVFVEMP